VRLVPTQIRRLHGISERVPGSHRYRLTGFGPRTGWFFTWTYARILRPGIASTLGHLPVPDAALRRCINKLEQESQRLGTKGKSRRIKT
jgi:hypothetical protein